MKASQAGLLQTLNGDRTVTFRYPAKPARNQLAIGAADSVLPASNGHGYAPTADASVSKRGLQADVWRTADSRPPSSCIRPRVQGRFLFVGEEKLYVRGVTYGTFRPDENGDEFPAPEVVERDFVMMTSNGINAVRTYTPAPRWLLDLAHRHGLWILFGLPVERSAGFMDYRDCARSIEDMVRKQVRSAAGHPAILAFTIGNEIPASVVRWHGHKEVERFLERLTRAAKEADPEGLVTYVNYPSTEYLQLPFLDFVSFNVYLESQERFEAYLARLHTVAGARPLLMTELGLDAMRHGAEAQARSLDWQVRTTFAAGCAGAFVYAWTDRWYRGGAEVHDWQFGLTTRERQPKPALAAVRSAFAEVPFQAGLRWPRVSVIVCSRNGARTIRDTFEGIRRLDYPDYEVIVVNDGSTDSTAAIASEYGFRVINTSHQGLRSSAPDQTNGHDWLITASNRGLSNARNLGLDAASGEIVAYIDDDAYPDPQWLRYLVASLRNPRTESYAGAGGPNLAPPGDGLIADCVAHSPGGPVHVLITSQKAEHIPGCNMAFRRVALKAIGGFDPQFHVAGDDVDVCWRLQQEGWTLAFSPSAVVWHHRRNSVRTYWRQQAGYGKAEAMLERKWPEKYNVAGHAVWTGRIYGTGMIYSGWRARRIYHGQWGSAPYQSLYEPAPSFIESLPMLPEWFLVVSALAVLALLGLAWPPLLLAVPLLLLASSFTLVQAVRCAASVNFGKLPARARWQRRVVTALLHLLHPVARLVGRTRHGLTLWRLRAATGYTWRLRWTADLWTRRSPTAEERLQSIEVRLREHGWTAVRNGDCDRWDLEVRSGILGSARLFLGLEHHGNGRQLLRIRVWPRYCYSAVFLALSLLAFAGVAAVGSAVTASLALWTAGCLIGGRTIRECAAASAAFLTVIRSIEREEKIKPE